MEGYESASYNDGPHSASILNGQSPCLKGGAHARPTSPDNVSLLNYAVCPGCVMTPRATQAALFDYALTVSGSFSANGTIGFDELTGSAPADPDFANFSLTVTNVGQ